jgi:hypothetical protein
MADIKKCAHPSCTCTVTKGEKFCSSRCEAAADTTEIVCECGHTGCSGDAIHT